MDPLTLRGIERILAVAIGGVSIVLGYRLFSAVPVQQDSSGTLKLPWNISVGLTRVGPGVFFALFGAAVVGYSLHGAIRVTDRVQSAGDGPPLVMRDVDAKGAMPTTAGSGENLPFRRANLGMEIEFLNRLDRMLRTDLSDEEKRAVHERSTTLKLALMKTVWGEDWGDQTAFRDWAEGGGKDAVPKGSEGAARFFRTGEEGAQ